MDFSLEIEPLTPEHNVSGFDCSSGHGEDNDLNDFIKNDALKQIEEGWNRTYVAVEKGTKDVIGFFAICQDALAIEKETAKKLNKPYQQIPAIKIARVAVDKNYQTKGVGEHIVCYAMGLIVEKICPLIGGVYITLDSYKHRVDWYKRHFKSRENTMISQNGIVCVNLIFPVKDFTPEK